MGQRGRKVKLKYNEVLSVAAPVVARSLAQQFFSEKVRLLSSTALLCLLATNAFAGKPVAPAAPSNLAANAVSSSEIDLTWKDNSITEYGFKIERAPTSGGTWTQIATVGAGVTNYANTGLAASTTCYYRVRAYTQKNSGYCGTA